MFKRSSVVGAFAKRHLKHAILLDQMSEAGVTQSAEVRSSLRIPRGLHASRLQLTTTQQSPNTSRLLAAAPQVPSAKVRPATPAVGARLPS